MSRERYASGIHSNAWKRFYPEVFTGSTGELLSISSIFELSDCNPEKFV